MSISSVNTGNFTAKQKASPKLEDLDQPENLDRMKPDEALRMALGYSQNDRVAFEVAKKRLRDLLECHFDWNRSFTEQTSATWASVNSEVFLDFKCIINNIVFDVTSVLDSTTYT